MAKKSKIVEIKAQSEPVRGVGPDADPSDPVLIMYPRGASEEIIGSLAGGDEDEAVIKTAGCIVPGDITVRYAAPVAGWIETTVVNKSDASAERDPNVATPYVYECRLNEDDILGPINSGDFCCIEISGDVDLSGKTISTTGEDSIDVKLSNSEISADIYINPQHGIFLAIESTASLGASISVNIKVTTVTENS